MSALLIKAISFAAEKHKNQRRKDVEASPYINHPIGLANVLANEGEIANIDALCAAILHDTIEDTETTEAELRDIFGDKITSIVLEVTDDKTLPKDLRKQLQIEHALKASIEAKLVKLADKICNVRDILSSPPSEWSEERKLEYIEWASKVVAQLKGTNVALESVFNKLISNNQ